VKNSSGLLPYADETVRGVLADAAALREAVDELLAAGGGGEADAALAVQEAALRRAKRCLVVYLAARAERVEALRWNTGTVAPPAARAALSNSEKDYFRAYGEAVTDYAARVGVDLTAVRGARARCARTAPRAPHPAPSRPRAQSLKPPKTDRIPVRTLKDCGVVETSDGPRRLCAGESHFMLRSDCEPLVRQGLMEEVPF